MKKIWFTLIEVLIVIVIIWILAWALVPRVWSAKDSANDSVRVTYAHWVSSAITQYHLDHQDYPEIDDSVKIWNCNCATLENALWNSLLQYGYWIYTLPKDPVVGSSFQFCWQEVTWGQFVYCKLNDGILFVSHLEKNWWNANSSDFDGTTPIDENTSRTEIESMLSTDWWNLYIYLWW